MSSRERGAPRKADVITLREFVENRFKTYLARYKRVRHSRSFAKRDAAGEASGGEASGDDPHLTMEEYTVQNKHAARYKSAADRYARSSAPSPAREPAAAEPTAMRLYNLKKLAGANDN